MISFASHVGVPVFESWPLQFEFVKTGNDSFFAKPSLTDVNITGSEKDGRKNGLGVACDGIPTGE